MRSKEVSVIVLFIVNLIFVTILGIFYAFVFIENRKAAKCIDDPNQIYAYTDFYCPEQLDVNITEDDKKNNITFPIVEQYKTVEECTKNLGEKIKIPVNQYDIAVDAYYDYIRQKDNCGLTPLATIQSVSQLSNQNDDGPVSFIKNRPMHNFLIIKGNDETLSRPATCVNIRNTTSGQSS